MQTEMKLEARHSTERLVITSSGEEDNTLSNFISAVASGAISIDVIKIHFPDSEMFSKSKTGTSIAVTFTQFSKRPYFFKL